MAKRDNKVITLGSGKLYVMEYSGTIPEDSTIEVDENLLGLIKGGANIAYTPEFATATDDLGLVKKQKILNEEVVLSTGLITWNGNTLAKLSATGRVTESNGIRTTKIGGLGNDNGKSYVLHFVHEDAADGDVRATIVGKNTSGFTLPFATEETTVDAEFNALPNDSEGTLLILKEEIPASS